ncbi:transmembrane protein 65 isoform X2 [Haematobia irritans]|uniref:transmembrane protein 65 isoform X2 n=1 Tax=Haematobia irritans TaxID=7368 RepID=UPI003F50A88B
MYNSQKLLSHFGRTLLKQQQQQQQFYISLQQQQKQSLLTLACCSSSLPQSTSENTMNKNNNDNSSRHRPSTSLLMLKKPAAAATTIKNYSKFTAARESLPLGSHPLCEERALDLISNLKETELAAIKLALQKYEGKKLKEGFEAEKAVSPSSSDLWKIFFVNAVPFVAFGFLDNFTMIIAGDYIEYIFGTFMCISTMAAAGLGNTISDVLGIGSAYYVERGCEILGLRPPDLTPVQMEMKSSRRAANYGRIIGITVGCLVGMFPLLFMDRKAIEDERKEEEERKKLEQKQQETTVVAQ